MLHILLFIVYFSACLFFIAKSSFFKKSNIPTIQLFILFSLKIVAGFLYVYYFSLPVHVKSSDTTLYFNESLIETDKLLNNPKLFFNEFWYNQYGNNSGLFTGVKSFWNDLKMTVFVKLLAVLNIFSFKNYHVNLIFFNFYVLTGGVLLYKLINYYFNIKQWILIVVIFLLPSFLFWSSGLHKDGIVFTSIAIVFYTFHCYMQNISSKNKVIIGLLHIVLLFLIRNYILLALFPILFSWWISIKFKWDSKKVFGLVYILCVGSFILSSLLPITSGISGSVVQKNHEFQLLEGNSKIESPDLENTTKSIINFLPFALHTVIFQPQLYQSKSAFLSIVALENYSYILLALTGLIFFFSKEKFKSPLLLSFITFTLFIYLFIGYTVCFGGAIVRYRSIILPFSTLPYIILIFGKLKTEKQS